VISLTPESDQHIKSEAGKSAVGGLGHLATSVAESGGLSTGQATSSGQQGAESLAGVGALKSTKERNRTVMSFLHLTDLGITTLNPWHTFS
jgi:hypothetical protein